MNTEGTDKTYGTFLSDSLRRYYSPVAPADSPEASEKSKETVPWGSSQVWERIRDKISKSPKLPAPLTMGGAGADTELLGNPRPLCRTTYRNFFCVRCAAATSLTFILGGAGSNTQLMRNTRPLSKAIFHSQHPDGEEPTEEQLNDIEAYLFLGPTFDCPCTQRFLTHRDPAVRRRFATFYKTLARNDCDSIRRFFSDVECADPPEIWTRKMNCQERDCQEFMNRCGDVSFDAANLLRGHKQAGLLTRNRCIWMSAGTFAIEWSDNGCTCFGTGPITGSKTICDPHKVTEFRIISELQDTSPLTAEQAAILRDACNSRRAVYKPIHSLSNEERSGSRLAPLRDIDDLISLDP